MKQQNLHHEQSEPQNIKARRTYKVIYFPVPLPLSCELGLQVSHWYSGGRLSHAEK